MALYFTHRNAVALDRIDLFHEGESLYPMWEVLHGAVPFRDVYLQHGLFHNAWFPALGSLLTGETYAAGRITHHLIVPLGSVAMYLLGMALFRGGVLTSLMLVFFFLTGISDRLIFTSVALALALAAMSGPFHFALLRPPPDRSDPQENRRRFQTGGMLFASGFFAAMAFWHSLDSGIFSIGAIGLFLFFVGFFQSDIRLKRRPIPFLAFAVGVLTGFWLFGVYSLYHGALEDLLRNIFIQSRYHLDIWGTRAPSLFEILEPLTEPGWFKGILAVIQDENFKFYWPAATMLLAVAVLVHRWLAKFFWSSRASVAATLITVFGLALFRGALGRSDPNHLADGALMGPVLIIFVLDQWRAKVWETVRARPRRTRAFAWALTQLTIAAMLAIGTGMVMSRDFNTIGRIKRSLQAAWTPPLVSTPEKVILPKQGPMTLTKPEADRARHVARVVEYIRAHTGPDDYVFDFSNQAAWLFLAERRSPTRYFMAVYASPPALQREVIVSLEEKQPALVIFKGGNWLDRIDGIRTDERLPLISKYLKENYEETKRIGKTIFLKQKPPSRGPVR